MGDRSNIVVKRGKDKVYLYGHWMGTDYINILATALNRAKDRWDDNAYIARVIFCDMVRGSLDTTTGYGISSTLCDNEHPLLVLNCKDQRVNLETEKGEIIFSQEIEYFLAHTEEYLKEVNKH